MRSSDPLAIAVDLGTTTLAASLVSLAAGERLASAGSLNPQREFGADVVSRLDAACRSEEAARRMAELARTELHRLAEELLARSGAPRESLRIIAVAGNPAMEHLLLGLPVRSLAFPPYRPLFSAGRHLPARELGWDLPAEAYLFPLPGGFVGGDTVAFLHGVIDPRSPSPEPRLYLDLGTNGEIALAAGNRLLATSAAAGPAFEGGNLACGMAALPGAISRVSLEGERLAVTTVGGRPPVGICGSGVLGAISLLRERGVIDATGRLLSPEEIPSNLGNRVTEVAGAPAFILHRDAARTVWLGQEDIRQVQLAKGAIRAGMEVLFQRAGIGADEVNSVILTGSFGAVLDPRSLKNVGIFTEKMVQTSLFVREGALHGVEKALLAAEGVVAAERLAGAIRVVPLSGTPAFEKHFLNNINFPEAER
ncbi:ASKHA domain-containing protein [Geobacter sp.]|uniref:ASKHA domain-containing protein n=1 Tax=Geobacter sp. TaxID=46610 RepID=UPI0026077EBE|nr:ASKHA domain-containing protein [Geobacter sp.]